MTAKSPARDAQAEAMQSIIVEVMAGKAPWARNGTQNTLITIACTRGEAERMARLVVQLDEPTNTTLAKALAGGLDRMAARAAAKKISAAVEAVMPVLPALRRPISPATPFPWAHIRVGTRVAIIEQLKTLPLPWLQMHRALARDFGVPKKQVISLILGVVLFGFDNLYLLGTRSIDELWDGANERWLRETPVSGDAP